MSSNRLEKINSLLEREISKIIARDFAFTDTLVTLTRVETFANLIGAKAHISVLPQEQIEKVVGVLNSGASSIQKKLNKMLNMRPVPKIMFVADTQTSDAARIEELLEKLKKEEK